MAAPNLSAFLNNKVKFDENELYQKYEDRLRSLFIFAENRGHKEIVVGPWGCGVFGLSPEKTSLIFNKIINENHYSGKIIFSIMNNEMFEIYKKNIFIPKIENLRASYNLDPNSQINAIKAYENAEFKLLKETATEIYKLLTKQNLLFLRTYYSQETLILIIINNLRA